jgi:hypothetical protein
VTDARLTCLHGRAAGHQATGDRARRGHRQQRRGEQPDGHADAAAPAHTRATTVVTGLLDVDRPDVERVTRITPSISTFPPFARATSRSKSSVAASIPW